MDVSADKILEWSFLMFNTLQQQALLPKIELTATSVNTADLTMKKRINKANMFSI
jgi:hypothetical protein